MLSKCFRCGDGLLQGLSFRASSLADLGHRFCAGAVARVVLVLTYKLRCACQVQLFSVFRAGVGVGMKPSL